MRLRLAFALVLTVLASCQSESTRTVPSVTPLATGATPRAAVTSALTHVVFIQRGPGAGVGLRLESGADPFVVFDTEDTGVISPDGRRLAFFVRDQGDYRQSLRVFDGSTGDVRELLRLSDESPSGYGWSEDGMGIAYGARSNRFERGGVDPPPTYTAVRLVELSGASPREVARVQNENLVVVGWRRADRQVLARSGWAEGASRPVMVGEDGKIHRAALGVPVSPQSIVASPDRAASAGQFWSASSTTNDSGIAVWSVTADRVLAERRVAPDSGVVAFAYVARTNDLAVLISRMYGPAPLTSLEVWPDHGRGTPRSIWTAGQLYSQGSQGFFLSADGTAAYVSFLYPGRPVDRVKVDLRTGQGTSVTFPTRTPYVGTLLVSDAAIARHRATSVTSPLGRADVIARVRALDRNVVRVDRIEAKLGSAAEVQRLVIYRTKLDVPADAPVWVVAVAGDVRAFTDTESFRLSWGAWFLDGRDGRVIGFDGDPRPGWPWFWDDLKDRAP